MPQEQLAEKLGVSRQAVTKWETDAGADRIKQLGIMQIVLAVISAAITDGIYGNWVFQIGTDLTRQAALRRAIA